MREELVERIRIKTATLSSVNNEMSKEINRLNEIVDGNRNALEQIMNDYDLSEEILNALRILRDRSEYKGAER
ncbi:MAG: hypothetical protein ACYDAO_08690 [Thermoplasmataceae archaeon]